VCSVPQGSVIGPVKYVDYTEDIADIPRQHGLHNHMYVDDIQLYVEVAVADVHSALNMLRYCISDVKYLISPYLKDVLLTVSSSSGCSGLRSATKAQYVKARLRTVLGESAFSFAVPKAQCMSTDTTQLNSTQPNWQLG